MSEYSSKELQGVVLPDWIQECNDFCASCVTRSTPRGKAADMWIEHGSDLVLKIRQLMVENASLKAIVAKLDRSLDGVPLVDGDEVWAVTDGDLVHGTYSVLGYYTPAEGFDGFRSLKGNHDRWICYLKYDPDTKTVGCWSTREAAEKVAKAKRRSAQYAADFIDGTFDRRQDNA